MSNPLIIAWFIERLSKFLWNFLPNDILHYSELYCSIHQYKLIHLKYIQNGKDIIETGYCPKCNKEYTEYKDISPIYISNYEWLYDDYNEK